MKQPGAVEEPSTWPWWFQKGFLLMTMDSEGFVLIKRPPRRGCIFPNSLNSFGESHMMNWIEMGAEQHIRDGLTVQWQVL